MQSYNYCDCIRHGRPELRYAPGGNMAATVALFPSHDHMTGFDTCFKDAFSFELLLPMPVGNMDTSDKFSCLLT